MTIRARPCGQPRRSGSDSVLLLRFGDQLGVDQLQLVRLGVRHRRLIYRLTTMLQMVGVIVWWIYFV
jgi:hypothetical protein